MHFKSTGVRQPEYNIDVTLLLFVYKKTRLMSCYDSGMNIVAYSQIFDAIYYFLTPLYT